MEHNRMEIIKNDVIHNGLDNFLKDGARNASKEEVVEMFLEFYNWIFLRYSPHTAVDTTIKMFERIADKWLQLTNLCI